MINLKLSDVGTVNSGAQANNKDMELMLIKGTHHYLSSKHIRNGSIAFEDAEKVRYKSIGWFEKYEVQAEDLLITYADNEFHVAVAPANRPDAFCSASVVRVQLEPDLFNPHVMKFYLESDEGQRLLKDCISNRALSPKRLKSLPIPTVDPEIQQEIGRSIQVGYKRHLDAIAKMRLAIEQEESHIRKMEEDFRKKLSFGGETNGTEQTA